MAELVKDLVLVSLGMGIGVVLMCIAQVSKMADEEMEEIKKERIDIEPCVNGNRGNRYLLRI